MARGAHLRAELEHAAETGAGPRDRHRGTEQERGEEAEETVGRGVEEEERIGVDLGGSEPLRLRDSAPDHTRVCDKEKGRYKATMRERKVKGEWKMKGQQQCTREDK